MKCPHCQIELPEKFDGPLCPACGSALGPISPPPLPAQYCQPKAPGLYWPAFWVVFLGCPALALYSITLKSVSGLLFFPMVGSVASGFLLARIFNRISMPFVVAWIVFTVGVMVVYFGLVFIGCLVVLTHPNGL